MIHAFCPYHSGKKNRGMPANAPIEELAAFFNYSVWWSKLQQYQTLFLYTTNGGKHSDSVLILPMLSPTNG
jgi:hypothetical protein